MSKQPANRTFQKQNQRLIRSTFKKGFVSAVYPNSRTADVSFASNPLTPMKNIPIASNVDITTIVIGQRCKVDVFDETNPSSVRACLLATELANRRGPLIQMPSALS